MPVELPAICTACSAVFPSGVSFTAGEFTATNNLTSCQNCGGIALIPDTALRSFENAIYISAATPEGASQWQHLNTILRDAKATGASGNTVADKIEKQAPLFTSIAEEFRKSPLGTTSMLLTLLLTAYMAVRPDQAPVTVIEQTINNYVGAQAHRAAAPSQQRKPSPGRNDRCHCGSGKRYKHCHGVLPAK